MRARAIWLMVVLWPMCVAAQDVALRYNTYGAPGLIDMPTARSAPDAELAFSVSGFAGQTRTTATFQISPRLSGSFRYAALEDVLGQGDVVYDNVLDRSFALHYRLFDESAWLPAIAVGVNDFVGTGIYSGEYVVATKALRPNLSFTAGLGWGRLAGTGSFDNPLGGRFADRPERDFGEGGTVTQNAFFKGDAAVFGGFDWRPTDDLGIVLEYSSDALPYESGGGFERRTPFNIALTYAPRAQLRLSAHYLYGQEVGGQLTYTLNPVHPPFGGGLDRAPTPVGSGAPVPLSRAVLQRDLAAEGLRLVAITQRADLVSVEVENQIYMAPAQAIGRTARILSKRAPSHVRQFSITLVDAGIASKTITLDRSELLAQEFALDGAAGLLQRAQVMPAAARPKRLPQPAFQWSVGPYLTPNLFDPDDPLRADLGAAIDVKWQPVPAVVVSGTLRQRIAGNLDQTTRMSDSVLPRVRSEFALYDREGDADIIDLTAGWYMQPSHNLTARVTFGLLEEMFGGISTELLWRPEGSPLAFGIEVNQVRQRGFESDFEFRDYEIMTGHASAYWDIGNGYLGRLDAGRYLAGDWGSTITLARTFRNGWSLGAFATFTDVSFEDFGEGSFDKGIQLRIPLTWISGQPSRQILDRTIRPVTRDGGARLNVEGRLYDLTRPLGQQAVTESWGRVWR